MQYLLIVTSLCSALYFLGRKKIDPLAVAFGACAIYFSPGLLGSIQFSKGAGLGIYSSPIEQMAYVSMIIVMMSVSAATVIHDRMTKGRVFQIPGDQYTPHVLAATMVTASTLSVLSAGTGYLCSDKALMLRFIDTWYYWASYALPLCLATALVFRNWLIVALCLVGIGMDLYLGFRVDAAICFISFCVLTGQKCFTTLRLFSLYAGIVVLGGAALFVSKEFANSIKGIYAVECSIAIRDTSGATESVQIGARTDTNAYIKQLRDVTGSVETYSSAILNSEPFVVQAVLNETIKSNFTTDGGYLTKQFLTGLPGGKSVFGLELGEVPLFADIYKSELFPDVPFGMASNPWAQAYAAGGIGMVTVFAVLYAAIVAALSHGFWKTRGSLRAFSLVASVWIAFYFHRNDLMTQIGILKHTFYLCLLAVFVSVLITAVKRRVLAIANREHGAI